MKPSFQINDTDKFWQDAADNAKKELVDIRIQNLKRAKKKKRKTAIILSVAALFAVACAVAFFIILLPQLKYNKALSYVKNGETEKAIEIFTSLGDYKDSEDRILRTRYDVALRLYNEGKYDEAYEHFNKLGDYSDSLGLKTECVYKEALSLMDKKQWERAKIKLEGLGNYKESSKSLKECNYQLGLAAMDKGNWEEAVNLLTPLADYKNCGDQLTFADYNRAKTYHKEGKYEQAIKIFTELGDYEDSKALRLTSMYAYVKGHLEADNLTTFEYLKELYDADFEDSKTVYKNLYVWQAKCIINKSKEDTKTDSSTLSRYDTVYFHVSLSGGPPNSATCVRYEIVFPGGSIQTGDFGNDWIDGSEGCTWVWFKNPATSDTGYAYIKLFDGDGNQIGEDKVYIGK